MDSGLPADEGFALPHGGMKLPIAGRDLNAFVVKSLQERGCLSQPTALMRRIAGIKQQYCFISSDFDTEI
jgi:actin